MLRAVKKGNPRVFTALAERAYGKVSPSNDSTECGQAVLLIGELPVPTEFRETTDTEAGIGVKQDR